VSFYIWGHMLSDGANTIAIHWLLFVVCE